MLTLQATYCTFSSIIVENGGAKCSIASWNLPLMDTWIPCNRAVWKKQQTEAIKPTWSIIKKDIKYVGEIYKDISLRGLPTETDENSWRLLQMSPCSVHQRIRVKDALKRGAYNTFSPGPRKQPDTRSNFTSPHALSGPQSFWSLIKLSHAGLLIIPLREELAVRCHSGPGMMSVKPSFPLPPEINRN